MIARTYIVRKSDSPELIADAYTGDRSRALEIVYANPQVPRTFVTLSDGRQLPTFRKEAFKYGMTLFLPNSFPAQPRRKLAGSMEPERAQCSPAPTAVHADFVYLPGSGELPIHIAQKWTGSMGRWRELVAANSLGAPAGSFVVNRQGGDCVFAKWPWQNIRIPASWPRSPRSAVSGSIVSVSPALALSAGVGLSAQGDRCEVGQITELKPWLYEVQGGAGPGNGELPYQVASHFNGGFKELMQANYDDPAGFQKDGSGNCTWWGAWAMGKLLKIPASWTDPSPTSTLWKHIKKTGGGGTTGGDTGTGGGTTGTSDTDTGAGAKKKDWTWAYVIGGAAAGLGGLVLVRAMVKKHDEKKSEAAAV